MVRDHSNVGPCKNVTDRSAASIGGQRPTTVRNLHGSFISKSWPNHISPPAAHKIGAEQTLKYAHPNHPAIHDNRAYPKSNLGRSRWAPVRAKL
ncbi:hypothetical protein ACLOJK_014599 [Asimina triloba]